MPRTLKPAAPKKAKKDMAAGYNKLKEFNGERYTGMKVGRTHHWYYDQGDWKEKKVTPEKWEITYSTVKRRAGKAPEGSGVPVGTGYHWFILAHQYVEKLNANDYLTQLVGLKYKLSHKRAGKTGGVERVGRSAAHASDRDFAKPYRRAGKGSGAADAHSAESGIQEQAL